MDRTSNTSTTALAQNLRALADLIDSVELPHQPYVTTGGQGVVEANWYLMHYENTLDGQKAAAATIVRALGGQWDKSEAYNGTDFNYDQPRDGLRLHVQVTRDAVCERIVTGTREVTIPAVEAKPERVETVEDVEWRCLPLLADEPVTA